jgi:hypothetical protein
VWSSLTLRVGVAAGGFVGDLDGEEGRRCAFLGVEGAGGGFIGEDDMLRVVRIESKVGADRTVWVTLSLFVGESKISVSSSASEVTLRFRGESRDGNVLGARLIGDFRGDALLATALV